MNIAFIHSDKSICSLFSLSQNILIMIVINFFFFFFLLMKYQLILLTFCAIKIFCTQLTVNGS